MKLNNCQFCEEVEKKHCSIIGSNRILAETETFVVFPTMGGFVDNYLLIVPQNHINCFGELTSDQLEELKSLIEWQRKVNIQYYDMNFSMFEHGALHPSDESGKSIVHAHLHIFPNNLSLIDKINEYKFKVEEIDSISELQKLCHEHQTYLYYGDVDNKDYIIYHQGIPSQFLRMALAQSLGKNNWNWRNFPLIDEMKNIITFYKENEIIYTKKKEKRNDSFTK